LARENDPVDLDGDGTFNDAVYIRTFGNDDIAFIDGAVLVNVTLRDAAGALCGANNTDRGEAVVRIPLPVPPCPADFNNSGTVTTSDISAFLTAWFADVVNGTTNADFNHSGSTTTADISAFLSAWFAAIAAGGCP
ncbi:MAG TPA: GC-type dockerin domain-anchored protein, partial [Phycisphaerales bacterium]|nr:GC-type dockerin domain-anchored protein [Phycisphaerales bacterium]